MTHAELIKRLFENQDEKYRKFNMSLTPGISEDSAIGVRVPVLRNLAKEFFTSNLQTGASQFKTASPLKKYFAALPHQYFEENQIHLFVVQQIRNLEECLLELDRFLPYVNNWAVCDGKTPKAFKTKTAEPCVLKAVKGWLCSDHPYVVRFAINILMDLFLNERFDPKFLKWVAAIDTAKFRNLPDGTLNPQVAAVTPKNVLLANPEYYVQMEIAWYFATALAKQWDATLPYMENRKLDPWTHNKTIQKSIESFRVSEEHKSYLKSLRW